MSQSERIDPLKVRHQELTNQSLEADLKPQPLSAGDKLNIDKNTQEQKVKKAAEFFYNILNSETEERRMSFIASAMDEAIASKDQEKIETSKRFLAASREEQDNMASAFLEANKYDPQSGTSSVSPSSKMQESQLYGELVAKGDQRTPREEGQFQMLKATIPQTQAEKTQGKVDEAEALAKVKMDQDILRSKTVGTDEYRETQTIAVKKAKALATTRTNLAKIQAGTRAAERVLSGVSKGTSGLTQAFFSKIPGTEQYDHKLLVDTLQAKLALNEMNALKANSPTGSTGFGQLSEKELATLQDEVAKLDPNASEASRRESLNIVLDHYKNAANLIRLEYMVPEKSLEGRIKQIKSVGLNDELAREVLASEGLSTNVQSLPGPIQIDLSDEELDAAIEAEKAKK
tara:strand:- start:2580 stop:3788 length:1209 start_codon:yes stop_codon:yes gene_type:complete